MILKFIIFNVLFYFIRLIVKNKIIPKLIAYTKKILIEYIADSALKRISL